MMNGPFFRSYSNQQPSRSARSVPVQQAQHRSLPNMVSVPVHFISSEQPRTTLSMLKDSAALKIQKVFRGFMVRKSVKKVASIRHEVSEIERRINGIEVVDLIRRDAKERLRMSETLMSLLFQLDSIRGVDCGVRILRKAVTRKAIALQEKVDSIAQADHQTLDSSKNDYGEIDGRNTSGQVAETSAVEDDADGGVVKEMVENCDPVSAAETCDVNESMEASPTAELTEIGKEDHTSNAGSMAVQKDEEDNDDRGNRELLKNLMADNDKMMKLMMQISERNEMQTRMINSLSRRVEQLENALMTDKLRRKKKTRVALRTTDKDNFSI
ncbi:hypothetical protein L1887_33016 [Cichorium endivia]|nr:hypothetical protein L1887_33016 [Cichorium endivia]